MDAAASIAVPSPPRPAASSARLQELPDDTTERIEVRWLTA